MKILYVLNDTFKKGGTESVVLNYTEHLNPDICTVDYMIHTTREEADSNQIYNKLLGKGVVVHVVTPRRISVRQNISDMKEVFFQTKYDIIHSHADCANALILSVAKKAGIKIRIAHSHNTESPVKIRNIKSLFHKAYLEWCRIRIPYIATHFMACSEKAGTWLFGRRNTISKKVYYLNNAIDLDRFRFDKNRRALERDSLRIGDRFVVGHIGRFSRQKNHPFILDMAERLNAVDDGIVFLLVGDGPDFEVVKKAADQKHLKNIIFYGATEQVESVIQSFDAFILPSLWEGLSVAIVEAQANGLRCFVSDTEKVDKDSAITPLVSFLPINDASLWCKEIINAKKNPERVDFSKELQNKGYDILKESRKLECYYLKAMND